MKKKAAKIAVIARATRTGSMGASSGSGPAGTLGESFTQLGSITPEGNVLFNVLTGQSVPTLLTLTGQITGEPLTARMALRTYEFSGSDPAFGAVGYAVIVPEPTT